MPKRKQSVKLKLLDGWFGGRGVCVMSRWDGVAFKIPKNYLQKGAIDKKVKNNNFVCFLFGITGAGGRTVYVGQASSREKEESLGSRLRCHNRSGKANWYEAIAFTTYDNSLNPSDLMYLERLFVDMCLKANSYASVNANKPQNAALSKKRQKEMDSYAKHAIAVLNSLGYNPFNAVANNTVTIINY